MILIIDMSIEGCPDLAKSQFLLHQPQKIHGILTMFFVEHNYKVILFILKLSFFQEADMVECAKLRTKSNTIKLNL